MRGLICDDHPLMRKAFMMALMGRWPNLQLSEVGSYDAAWAAAESQPDFLIADLAMPGATPVEGIAKLKELTPETTIIVLTGLVDPPLMDQVVALGVTAILPKILDGELLLDRLAALLPGLNSETGGLPPRQREVLQLLGHGLTNKEIALRLGIAPATVKVHVSRLIEQLGAANRTDAVSKAQRSGLI